MPEKKEQGRKVPSAPKRAHFTDGDSDPTSHTKSPAPGNRGSHSSQGSPSQSQHRSNSQSRSTSQNQSTSQAGSHQQPEHNTPGNSASSSNAAAPSGPNHHPGPYGTVPATVAQPSVNATPFVVVTQATPAPTVPTVPTVPTAPTAHPFVMANQQNPPAPSGRRCPPDPLGPPPPLPPPPAIPPVVNPYGVHFQPPVPATNLGPMVHHYIPRHDPAPVHQPGVCYPAQQFPGFMVSASNMRVAEQGWR